MGFLDRAIKNGISKAVSSAVAESVKTVVQPKVDAAAANVANKTAAKLNSVVGEAEAGVREAAPAGKLNTQEVNEALGTLGGIFGSFQSAAMGMANEAAKSMKICDQCGEPTSADKTFCPSCGARLPEGTVADGALCPQCGQQNEVGTKFCAGCGAKLPATLAEEAQFDADWDTCLSNYPKWTLGGMEPGIESMGTDDKGRPYYEFHVRGVNSSYLQQYKDILRQNGFRQPVRYSTDEELYKVIDGVSYSVNSSEPFAGDADCLSLYFHIQEFDETPEPKKAAAPQIGLDDIKKLFKF